MRKLILAVALTASVSGCLQVGNTFQRWVGVYEYEGTSYRVALVESLTVLGDVEMEYHLVPASATTYRPQDMVARCDAVAPGDVLERIRPVTGCEEAFGRQIEALTRPPMMEGGGY